MKTCMFGCGLFFLIVTCLLINAGCVTKRAGQQDVFRLEGLERAAGPQDDTPVIY